MTAPRSRPAPRASGPAPMAPSRRPLSPLLQLPPASETRFASMSARPMTHCRRRAARPLLLEVLEPRSLPSHTSWPGLSGPHVGVAGATLDAAYLFPAPLTLGGRAEAIGTISN